MLSTNKKTIISLIGGMILLVGAGCQNSKTIEQVTEKSTSSSVQDEVKISTSSAQENNSKLGTIEGNFSFPSESIGSDVKACAETVADGKTVQCVPIACYKEKCSNEMCGPEGFFQPDNEGKIQVCGQEKFSLKVPAGEYFVYQIKADSVKAYYTEFVTCGLKAECPSHKKIPVKVEAGKTVTADPGDWYDPAYKQ